jgi:hypothetical protein
VTLADGLLAEVAEDDSVEDEEEDVLIVAPTENVALVP